jgi:hypothetical protein
VWNEGAGFVVFFPLFSLKRSLTTPYFHFRLGDEASTDWLPSSPTSFLRLKHLHLTGLPRPSPTLFLRSVVLTPTQRLSTLTLEDFDALSSSPLLSALQSVPALSELEELNVAFAREVEMEKADGGEGECQGSWAKEKEEVERWCEGKGRLGKATRLKASWSTVKVTGCGFW